MKRASISSLFIFILWLIIFTSFFTISAEARKSHKDKSKMHKHRKPKTDGGATSPAGPPGLDSTNFGILSFGAKGDGHSDDSKALLAAWKTACKVAGGIIHVPSGQKFLIKPITLEGRSCMPNLIFQVDGTLSAPPKIGSWSKSDLYQWVNFKWVQNFTIQGTGTFDGQGSNWWSTPDTYYIQKKKSRNVLDMKPTALRFYDSHNITVQDIRIINSPLCHLKFDSSRGVRVDNITISAPESSPNTDGIHLQNTRDVEIQHSNIASGDDCVSVQTGCSNIHINHINCGPGHGISLGGLGKDRSVACVSNIVVENIVMENTLYGARIKTWQGGLGSVKNVTFSNIKVFNVKIPIMIDQYYCDKELCRNQTGAVAILGVKFNQITGTYTSQPINLACSKSIPCTDVDLIDIQLEPSPGCRGHRQAMCWNSYGRAQAPLVPSEMDDCARRGSDFVRRIARSHENSCVL